MIKNLYSINKTVYLNNAKVFAFSLFFYLPLMSSAQVIFTQDFNSSTVVADYHNFTNPTANQADFIGTSGTSSIYLSSGRLQFQRNNMAAAFVRATDFAPTPSVLKVKFKIVVPFCATIATNAAVFQVGAGFTASAVGEAVTNLHSRLGVSFPATNTFHLRNITTAANSPNYTSEQTVTWYINNSGRAINYLDPTGARAALGDDMSAVWVGTSRIFDTIPAVNIDVPLTDFKFFFNNSTGAIALDDIEISRDASVLPVSVASVAAKTLGISPNPTSDKIRITLSDKDPSVSGTMTVYDFTGRQVLRQKTTADALELDVSSLTKGAYLVKIDTNNSLYTGKFLRQ